MARDSLGQIAARILAGLSPPALATGGTLALVLTSTVLASNYILLPVFITQQDVGSSHSFGSALILATALAAPIIASRPTHLARLLFPATHLGATIRADLFGCALQAVSLSLALLPPTVLWLAARILRRDPVLLPLATILCGGLVAAPTLAFVVARFSRWISGILTSCLLLLLRAVWVPPLEGSGSLGLAWIHTLGPSLLAGAGILALHAALPVGRRFAPRYRGWPLS